MQRHKKQSGLPTSLNAAYNGYSGLKNLNFPISSTQSITTYPDITVTFNRFKNEIVAELKAVRPKMPLFGHIKAFKMLASHFPTAEAWDSKYHPDFPGRDLNGRLQYARYKGRVVSATYLSNALYGQVLAALGYPLWFIRLAAHMDACGVAEILFKRQLPGKKLRKFRDTPEDQQAIRSGYYTQHKNNPWLYLVSNTYVPPFNNKY